MTRVVVISDTHNKHKSISLPDGDVLIHCGDWSTYGTDLETTRFIEWIGKQPHKYKLVVPGNHDEWVYSSRTLAEELFAAAGAHLLIDTEVEIDKKRFFGSPWTPRPRRDMAFTYGRHRGDLVWESSLIKEYDVLITHTPPCGIGDYVPHKKVHAGCPALLYRVFKYPPRYHVFGHIHEGYGRRKSDSIPTVFVNAASWDHHEDQMRKPIVLEI